LRLPYVYEVLGSLLFLVFLMCIGLEAANKY
jgi:hypothetical protein